MLEIEIDMIIEIAKEVWEGFSSNYIEESHKFLVDDILFTPKPLYWSDEYHSSSLGMS